MNDDLTKEPWEFDADDLSLSEPLYKASRPYRIWHEYLRLSPTFSLPIKQYDNQPRNEKFPHHRLTNEEQQYIQDDFPDVVRTYRDFSRRSFISPETTFKRWWDFHGANIFGYRHAPSPISLMTVSHNSPVDINKFIPIFNNYLDGQRQTDGMTGFELLAVPLSGNKKQILATISNLLDENEFKPITKRGETSYELLKGKQLAKLSNGLRLLWFAALEPDLENWRLGKKAGVSSYTYRDLDPKIVKHTTKTKELSERLATTTCIRLKEAVIIMENAARGRFPCTDEALLPKFNQDEMIRLVGDSINRRLRHEENRKRAEYEAHFRNQPYQT